MNTIIDIKAKATKIPIKISLVMLESSEDEEASSTFTL